MARDTDQGEVFAFLSDPATHGIDTPVEVIETHLSWVFLAGDRALKMKRARRLPYADFSTLALRLENCERELALNAPHAPGLYLGVRRITRAPGGGLEFDGPGALVEAVVEMARFEPDALLSSIADRGGLNTDMIEAIAHATARWHAGAAVMHGESGAANIAAVLKINRAGFATSSVFEPAEVEALDSAFRDALARHANMLNRREAQGLVRRCHGDLHLGNICMFRGRPTPFDCIEFNDRIATIDVLYDLAFLLMDLWHRGHAPLANLAANRYCDETGEDEGFVLLPFFMALRAAVRAHVTATQADMAEVEAGAGAGARARLAATARQYFDLARQLLHPAPQVTEPAAVIIGGFSGTGKTTIAEALSAHLGPPPGARIIESDRTRKALFGVPADTRLPAKAYAPEVSERVYRALSRRAAAVVKAGGSVVVDAVFDRPDRRHGIEAAIRDTGRARPLAIWLEADETALRERVRHRRGGPSDATVEVLERQLARDPGPIGWHRLRSDRPVAEIVDEILALVKKDRGGGSVRTGRS